MPTISLIPQWALDALQKNIGARFDGLAPEAKVALATAMIEGDVTNTRMQDLINDHPTGITKLLRGLAGKGLLETDNQRRWTRYRLPATIGPHIDLFSSANVDIQTSLQSSSSFFDGNSSPLLVKDKEMPTNGEEPTFKCEEWRSIAAKIASKGKVSTVDMEAAIVEACRGRYFPISDLAKLLNRGDQFLRNKYLTPMVRAGKLRFRYPSQPNHKDQAYTTADEAEIAKRRNEALSRALNTQAAQPAR